MSVINQEMIAKDNLITKVLFGINSLNLEAPVILKGGTSLTKTYGYSDRMSEDLDLVLLTKNERIQKVLRDFLTNNFGFAQHNPGHQRRILSGYLKLDDVSIKIDIKIVSEESQLSKRQIMEFNQKGELVEVEGLFFNAGNLEQTFLQKIFAFQNKAYVKLVKNKIGRAKRFSSIPDISADERSNSDLPRGEIVRLARHFYDITKIWDDVTLNKALIVSMISMEKENVRVVHSPYLSYVYENFSLDQFLIFNLEDKVIEKWLRDILNNFVVDINIQDVISSVKSIKAAIKQILVGE